MVGERGQRQDAYFRLLVWLSLPLDAVIDLVLLPADSLALLAGQSCEERALAPVDSKSN